MKNKKGLLTGTILLIILNLNVMAQKGFTVEREVIVNVSADKLWEIVGPGFANVYKWSSNVDHSVGKGVSKLEGAVCDERFCDVNVKGFNKISEKLIEYNDQKMNLAYEVIDGMPSFIIKAVNDWTIIPMGPNKSKFVMKADFASKGLMGTMTRGMMKKKMETTLETVLNDGKAYAETGEISQAKKERIYKLEKKMKKAA